MYPNHSTKGYKNHLFLLIVDLITAQMVDQLGYTAPFRRLCSIHKTDPFEKSQALYHSFPKTSPNHSLFDTTHDAISCTTILESGHHLVVSTTMVFDTE
jgi:hypothetical protein